MRNACATIGGVVCLGVLACRAAGAAGVAARSCSREDVQAALDAARAGDIVTVPAGRAIWTGGVTASKAVMLVGAGMEQTVIVDRGGSAIRVTKGARTPFRITGLGFDGTGSGNTRSITLADGSYVGFRIDHCRFLNERHALDIHGVHAEGVIDNCLYSCLECKGGGDHVAIYVSGERAAAWKRPPGFGTADAVYVEDCRFEYFDAGNSDRPYLGMGNGARVVFRHNVGKNGCFEAFGACSYYTSARSTVLFEAYRNVLSGKCYCLFTIKGGTATIFDNTITGYSSGCFELTNYRSRNYGTALQYGACDGMRAIDGNAPVETGRHTGGDDQSVLTCSGRRWAADQWVGYALWNVTDDSVGRITANTQETITTAGGLVEGYTIVDSGTVTAVKGRRMTCAGKKWQWGGLKSFCHVYNVTGGSHGLITANGATTITAALQGGVRSSWQVGDIFQVTQKAPHGGIEKDWDTGDAFKITNGYPCMDQIGRGQDAGPQATEIQPQLPCPLYEWNNMVNGKNLNPRVHSGGTRPCSERDHIKEGRDYFVDTPRPGYVPYAYPHPLRGETWPPGRRPGQSARSQRR